MVWWLLLTGCHAFVVFVTYAPGTAILSRSYTQPHLFVNFSFIYLGCMEIKTIWTLRFSDNQYITCRKSFTDYWDSGHEFGDHVKISCRDLEGIWVFKEFTRDKFILSITVAWSFHINIKSFWYLIVNGPTWTKKVLYSMKDTLKCKVITVTRNSGLMLLFYTSLHY